MIQHGWVRRLGTLSWNGGYGTVGMVVRSGGYDGYGIGWVYGGYRRYDGYLEARGRL